VAPEPAGSRPNDGVGDDVELSPPTGTIDMENPREVLNRRVNAERGGGGARWASRATASTLLDKHEVCHRCGRVEHQTRVCMAECDMFGTPLKERFHPAKDDKWRYGGCGRCGNTTHLASGCKTATEWM
jgi:hypothetical protein